MTSRRDAFLDGVRAISVLRVISLHLMQRVEHPFVAAFSFLMPGIPLMLFVSGALAAQSLGRPGAETRRRFWRERGRRLLFPFWAFGGAVVATCLVAWWFQPDSEHALPLHTAWAWFLPLIGPQASAAFDRFDWHLWFLSSLLLLLASAPWTVKLHRRLPFVGALACLAAGAAIEIAQLSVPGVLRNTLLFGAAFQLGYGYADGRLLRLRKSLCVAAALVSAGLACTFYFLRAPGQMLHAAPLALVLLGLAFVGVWLALRDKVLPLFERAGAARAIGRINKRAYSLYLWGPIANEIAWYRLRPDSGLGYALDFALSVALLLGLVVIFGRVEDWAARRRAPSTETARLAAPRVERGEPETRRAAA